jgi:hypothetical protein
MILKWEEIKCELVGAGFFNVGVSQMFRAKVPGGWFIQIKDASNSGFFYPDPEHLWDGSSLP